MASTTIRFEKDGVQPPVYVAGEFTDWQPVEMTCKTSEINNVFSHKATLEPGKYQYKFRLGPGDWWVLDESSPFADDGHGNVNNVLAVGASKSESLHKAAAETKSEVPSHVSSTNDAHATNEPNTNGYVEHDKAAETCTAPTQVVSQVQDSPSQQQSAAEVETSEVDGEKEVQFDEQTGKITATIVPARKDSLPDFAPPPYSVAADGTLTEPGEEVQVAPISEAPPQKEPETWESLSALTDKSNKSLVAQLCSGSSLVMVMAMVAIPVAVSYYLRR